MTPKNTQGPFTRQRQRNDNVPWDKIEQVSIFVSLSVAVSITHASVERRKKYRCVHSALALRGVNGPSAGCLPETTVTCILLAAQQFTDGSRFIPIYLI